MTALIAGILRLDGARPDPARLQAMLDAMTPGDARTSRRCLGAGPVALGALTAVPAGMAPPAPAAADTGAALTVADIRLHQPAAEGAGALDAVEAALAASGERAVAGLHGDFALARWERASGTLTLWRDGFGVRPLHHAHRPGEWLAFASLPGALLAAGFAGRAPDPVGCADMVENAYHRAPHTLFRDIAALAPGHVLAAGPDGVRPPRRVWTLASPTPLPVRTDPRAVAEETRRLLDQAVRRRLPARGPPAGDLSGGLDSSTISALAARAAVARGARYHAYAFCAPRGSLPGILTDEEPHIRAVADAEPGLDLRMITGPAMLDCFRDGTCPETGLCVHPAYPDEARVAAAAAAGAPVLLSGCGGDEGVTGFGLGAHAELFRTGHWGLLLEQLRAVSARTGRPLGHVFLHRVLRQSLPLGLRRALRRVVMGPDPVSATIARRRAFLAPALQGAAPPFRPVDGPDPRALRLRGLGENALMAARLQSFSIRAARHGVSYAFPMLDRDLVGHVLRLPAWLFVRDGVPRSVLRDAMAPLLPPQIVRRQDKMAPFPQEILHTAERRAETRAALDRLGRCPEVRAVLDTSAIAEYVRSGPEAEALRRLIETPAPDGPALPYRLEAHDALRLAHFLSRQGGAR